MLTITPEDKTREDYEKERAELIEEYEEALAKIQELGDSVDALNQLWNKKEYKQLQRYFKDTLGPEILRLRETVGDTRLEEYHAKRAVDKIDARIEALKNDSEKLTEEDRALGPEQKLELIEELEAERETAVVAHSPIADRLRTQEARLGFLNGIAARAVSKKKLEPGKDDARITAALEYWQQVKSRAKVQLANATGPVRRNTLSRLLR